MKTAFKSLSCKGTSLKGPSLKGISRAAGFTLIEALVAMFIFAWISLAAYQILDQVIRAQEINQKKSAYIARNQRVVWQLAKDFRQMVNRPVLDSYGNALDAFDTDNDLNLIEFTRSGWSNPLQWPRSDLQRVAYRVDFHPDSNDSESEFYNDERLYLIRLYWQVLDRTADTEPQLQVLLGGITDFRVRFWDDEQDKWVESEPKANSAVPAPYQLPETIEVSIVLESDDVISQIYRVQ